MSEPLPQVVRVAAARPRAEEWALALAAIGIASRIDWGPQHGYLVVVEPQDAAHAIATLRAYDDENRPRVVPVPPAEYGRSLGAVVAAVVICAMFVVTGPRADGHPWFDAGAANAARMEAGEWWRAVTALTLHADFPHVLGNTISLLLFGTALCALVGPGVGLWLALLAGTGGNLLNTALRGAPHSAIGASTAIFGVIGGLAAVRVMQRRRGADVSAWRAWAPLGAGIALLGLLGSSERSDVLAHLFGFGVGVGLGAATAAALPEPLERRWQFILAGAAAVAVGLAWALALR